MYLEHFGLKEAPFKITPVTDFFFPGANRAEILDALLYAITNSEGIIKVTGEVGSGKTMLCRMLLEKFPEQVEAVYLANPSLSREEMLYAIADGLNLNLEGQRVNIILQTLQNHLELKITQGKRVVILVDEAHAMPLETMEELRLLYNLQVGNHKLLHIVLFGQPELNEKLNQPNMRQLKDRIIHHFSMLPLSQNIIESYLLFRMRTAGYRGPTPFSIPAATLIGKASQGLMRRVNILADKALLAAFVENTHGIETRHVQAAIRDTELGPAATTRWQQKHTIMTAALAAAILLAAAGWYLGRSQAHDAATSLTMPITRITPASVPVATAAIEPATAQNSVDTQDVKLHMSPSLSAAPVANTSKASTALPAPAPQESLLDQRIASAKKQRAFSAPGSASIQLYYTDNVKPARIEAFLKRADSQGALNNIYIYPIKINGRKGYRVLYGIYPNSEKARSGMRQLPQRFRDSFAPTIFLLEDLPTT
jgi:type II secretory pathway predicted ATPase ExeA